MPADGRDNPEYRSRETRPPSIIPRPPGVSDSTPSRRDRIEIVISKFKEKLRFKAKATSFRRIISRAQTPLDRRRIGIKDFLNCFQLFCTFFSKEANFDRKYHIVIPAARRANNNRLIDFNGKLSIRGMDLNSKDGKEYRI